MELLFLNSQKLYKGLRLNRKRLIASYVDILEIHCVLTITSYLGFFKVKSLEVKVSMLISRYLSSSFSSAAIVKWLSSLFACSTSQ